MRSKRKAKAKKKEGKKDLSSMFFITLLQQTGIQEGKLHLFCKSKCAEIIFLHGDHYSDVVSLETKRRGKKYIVLAFVKFNPFVEEMNM